jgi:hypothetical protein
MISNPESQTHVSESLLTVFLVYKYKYLNSLSIGSTLSVFVQNYILFLLENWKTNFFPFRFLAYVGSGIRDLGWKKIWIRYLG